MIENIRMLYRCYGGVREILRSNYFWISIFLSIFSYDAAVSQSWVEIAISIMPSLTGFTIASFAIIFSILGPNLLRLLTPTKEGGVSPIVSLAASICHAVVVQVLSITTAISFSIIKIPFINENYIHNIFNECTISIIIFSFEAIKYIFSFIGVFFTYYGLMLVVAAALSIFRVQLIVSTTQRKASAPKNT